MNDLASLQRQLTENGYCCLDNVIAPNEVDRVRQEVTSDVWAHTVTKRPKGYVPGFLRFNQSVVPYLTNPRLVGLVKLVLGQHRRISMFTGVVTAPGLPRGRLHSDWPFNQRSQAHIPAPYPDAVFHLVTFWMLTDFRPENGATIIVPRSHRKDWNPSADVEGDKPHPEETRLVGEAGTVAVFDARLWHAEAPNVSTEERVAVIVRFAPWWLNLDPLRPGTVDHQDIVEANNGPDSVVPPLPRDVYDRLPDEVKSLLHYSVEGS